MTKLHLACVLVFFSAVSALAMPSRSDLQKVQGAVNELMADSVAAMKKGKLAPEKAAETALGYAREATDEASKFLFYKGAFGLFVQGRRYDEAVKAVETLTQEVKGVPDKVVADIIREKLKRVSKKDGGAVFELYDRIDRRVRSAAEREKLEAALKANPKDADARRQLAFCKASLGDWAGALGDFALVGGKVSEAAKTEQAGKAAEAADLWWTASDDDADQSVLREHAAGLYRYAMDGGKLQGIKLALAKKRVAECGTDAPAAASAASAPAATESTSVATQSGPKKSSAAPAVRGRYDWTIPDGLTELKRIDFDFGRGAEKLAFFAVSGGKKGIHPRWHAVTFEVTRPFWIAQMPLSVKQFCAFPKAELHPEIRDIHAKLKKEQDVVVLARARTDAVYAYLNWLNKTYGKLLPPGWVFRLPTIGEWSVVEYSVRVGMPEPIQVERYKKAVDDAKAFLEARKFFPEQASWQTTWPVVSSLIVGATDIRGASRLPLTAHDMVLDSCAFPDIRGSGNPESDRVWSRLGFGAEERDPFRYCELKTPYRRNASAGGTWHETFRHDDHGVTIRLAVGFDYVGEWKAKQGKK